MIKAALALLLLTCAFFSTSIQAQQASGPALLTYNELVALYETDPPAEDLANKLRKLLTTPFVNNASGTRATKSRDGIVRVATWNIERGLEFEAVKAALTNDQRFFRRLPAADRGSSSNLTSILEQAAELSRAD